MPDKKILDGGTRIFHTVLYNIIFFEGHSVPMTNGDKKRWFSAASRMYRARALRNDRLDLQAYHIRMLAKNCKTRTNYHIINDFIRFLN